MRRHGLHFRIKHGESGSVNKDDVREGLQKILDGVDLYDPKDLFNMDESGLCYARTPVADIFTQ